MNKEINITHLIILIIVLFGLYYLINGNSYMVKIEKFDDLLDNPIDKKNKSCSQDSINYSVHDYIFAKTPFTRP